MEMILRKLLSKLRQNIKVNLFYVSFRFLVMFQLVLGNAQLVIHVISREFFGSKLHVYKLVDFVIIVVLFKNTLNIRQSICLSLYLHCLSFFIHKDLFLRTINWTR